jgi:hypothetical protein
MGIAEREREVDNAAFTNMATVSVQRSAIDAANRLGCVADPAWAQIAEKMVIPRREHVIVSHDEYRTDEEKGATPDPLVGTFPLGVDMTPEVEAATLKFYLSRCEKYLGSPIALGALWSLAVYTGDRALAAKLMEDGIRPVLRGSFLPDA